MKAYTILWSWLTAVILGSVTVTIIVDHFNDQGAIILISLLLSALCSLPYLLIMILVVVYGKLNMIQNQLVHLGLALLTTVIGYFVLDAKTDALPFILPYYGFGVIAQFIFHRLLGPRGQTRGKSTKNLLDDDF